MKLLIFQAIVSRFVMCAFLNNKSGIDNKQDKSRADRQHFYTDTYALFTTSRCGARYASTHRKDERSYGDVPLKSCTRIGGEYEKVVK